MSKVILPETDQRALGRVRKAVERGQVVVPSSYAYTDSAGNVKVRVGKLKTSPSVTPWGIETDEVWHIVGNAGEPAYQNGWSWYGSPYSPARFRKMPDGQVILGGMIKNGTLAADPLGAFVLPAGYRPAYDLIISVMSGNALGELIIGSGTGGRAVGEVAPWTPGSNAWFSLENISFYAEQ